MRDLSDEEVRRLAGEPCDNAYRGGCPVEVVVCGGRGLDRCHPCRARRDLARREERGRK
jgi:hypothetical protein